MTALVYRRVSTSAEVYAVIRARHAADMAVFSSYSAPDGDHFGDPETCVMETDWGLKGQAGPLLGIRTTWQRDREHPAQRPCERHEYWLWQAIEPRDEPRCCANAHP